jgi:hypothetical protein
LSQTTTHVVSFRREPPSPAAPVEGATRIQRLMALAIHFEGMLRSGQTSHVEIARRYGLSRARVTQIVNLTNLAPAIQEGILLGVSTSTERDLRRLATLDSWAQQLSRDIIPT